MVNLPWFALQVRARSEKLVAQTLEAKRFETFLPLYTTRRRWSDRLKQVQLPFFDGYVFCKLDPLHRLPVLTIPGVIHFVGFGKIPDPIPECEIAALQSVVRSGAPVRPWPFLRAGERVRLEDGPLRDLEGILLHDKGADRLVVSVSLLQRSVAVELDRDWVIPASCAAGRPRPVPPVTAYF